MQTQDISYDTRYAEQLIKSFNALPKTEGIESLLTDMLSWEESFLQRMFYFKEDDCLSTPEKPVHSLAPSDQFKSLYKFVTNEDWYSIKVFQDEYFAQLTQFQGVNELFD